MPTHTITLILSRYNRQSRSYDPVRCLTVPCRIHYRKLCWAGVKFDTTAGREINANPRSGFKRQVKMDTLTPMRSLVMS